MKNHKDDNDLGKKGGDNLSESRAGKNEKVKPADDAFKTANRKHKLEWKEPLDEQMFDSRDDE